MPAIQVLLREISKRKPWMPGTSPGMTELDVRHLLKLRGE
jgi:hypothetical protein